jgi:hypothetical protein
MISGGRPNKIKKDYWYFYPTPAHLPSVSTWGLLNNESSMQINVI